MKAAFIERTGPPEVIRVGDLPDPVAGPGQARSLLYSASHNHLFRGGA